MLHLATLKSAHGAPISPLKPCVMSARRHRYDDPEEEIDDMNKYMTEDSYDGFEGEGGFFAVYRTIFENLAADERSAKVCLRLCPRESPAHP